MTSRALLLFLLLMCGPVFAGSCTCDPPTIDTSPPPGQEIEWERLVLQNQNATTTATFDSVEFDMAFAWSDRLSLHAHFVIVGMRVYVDGDAAGTNLGNGVFDGTPADELVADLDTSTFGWPVGLGLGGGGIQQTVPTTLTFTQPITLPTGAMNSRTIWVRLVTGPAGLSYDNARETRMTLQASPPGLSALGVSGVPTTDIGFQAAAIANLIYGERSLGACAHDTCGGSDVDCAVREGTALPMGLLLLLCAVGVWSLRARRRV